MRVSSGFDFSFAKELTLIIRDACHRRLASSVPKSQVVIENLEKEDDFIYGQWMSLILLVGPSLQITLKAHYFNKAVHNILHKNFEFQSKISANMIMDFMREFLNLASGEIKASLAKHNISIGLSLPLITRGFDEVLFSDQIVDRAINDWWQFKSDFGAIICSAEIEIFQPEEFKDLDKVVRETESTAVGDIDFL